MEKMTIQKAIERYINNMERTNQSKNTITAYKTDYNIFQNYMEVEVGIEYIEDVDEDNLLDYRDYLYDVKGYKIATVNRKLNALKSLFTYLENLRIINVNYMKVIPTTRPFADREKVEILEPDELDKILSISCFKFEFSFSKVLTLSNKMVILCINSSKSCSSKFSPIAFSTFRR